MPSPLALAAEPAAGVPGAGMMLPGKGRPVFGSTMTTGILLPLASFRVTKGLFGSRSSLKLPWRIKRVGTVRLLVSVKTYLTHSSPQYQKTLVLLVLKWFGM